MQCRMLYFTVQTASAGLSRHERNRNQILSSHTVKQSLSKEIRRAEHESGHPREFAGPGANPLWWPHA